MIRIKEINFRHIVKTVFWSSMVAGFIALMGFVSKSRDEQVCTGLEIKVHYNKNDDNAFIEPADIENMIFHQTGALSGRPVSAINLSGIESTVIKNNMIDAAEVYITLDGKVKIDIRQRQPLLRIITYQGYSYYMDVFGNMMPLSVKYTARVPVVNGFIMKDDTSLHKRLFILGKYIAGNDFWNSMITQIFVDNRNEFVLFPRVGNFRIIFGNAADMEEKFNKLYLIYTKGLPHTGWNRYSQINLKFNNQVVCTNR